VWKTPQATVARPVLPLGHYQCRNSQRNRHHQQHYRCHWDLQGPVSNGGMMNDISHRVIAGTITGTLETDAKVVVFDNGAPIGEAIVNGTNWTYSASGLTQGSHSFRGLWSKTRGVTRAA
jgi:hypothetical protein